MTKAHDFCKEFGEYWNDECGKKRWNWIERFPNSYTEEAVMLYGGIVATVMQNQPNVKYIYKVGFVTNTMFDNRIPTDYNLIVFHDGSWIIDNGCAELSDPDIGYMSEWNGPSANLLDLAKDTYNRLLELKLTKEKT